VTCDGKPIRRLVFINGGICLSKRWRHRLLKIVVISRLKIAPIFFSQVAIQHQLGTNRADTSSLSSECCRRKNPKLFGGFLFTSSRRCCCFFGRGRRELGFLLPRNLLKQIKQYRNKKNGNESRRQHSPDDGRSENLSRRGT
jgi:hypothetical protein